MTTTTQTRITCRNCGETIREYADDWGNQWVHNTDDDAIDCPDSSGVIVAEPSAVDLETWETERVEEAMGDFNLIGRSHDVEVTLERDYYDSSRRFIIWYGDQRVKEIHESEERWLDLLADYANGLEPW